MIKTEFTYDTSCKQATLEFERVQVDYGAVAAVASIIRF